MRRTIRDSVLILAARAVDRGVATNIVHLHVQWPVHRAIYDTTVRDVERAADEIFADALLPDPDIALLRGARHA